MRLLEATTLGEAWLDVAVQVLEQGADSSYDGLATKELALLTLIVERPDAGDSTIAELGDPEWLAWMHSNFADERAVPELGDAASYAQRLFDYARSGRDQLAWVVDRLRRDPASRSATITTFEPLSDESYIPCVSTLDFWLPDGRLELVVYAHSLDFGKKANGNLVELAHLQQRVADELGVDVGRLVIHAKSAHVYEPEWAAMRAICTREPSSRARA